MSASVKQYACRSHDHTIRIGSVGSDGYDLAVDDRIMSLSCIYGSDTWSLDRAVFMVAFKIPQSYWTEFEGWYVYEHGPMLLRESTWRAYRLFSCPPAGRESHTHVVLHDVEGAQALESAHRKLSRRTPWFQRLSRHEWFDGPFERHFLVARGAQ